VVVHTCNSSTSEERRGGRDGRGGKEGRKEEGRKEECKGIVPFFETTLVLRQVSGVAVCRVSPVRKQIT
jgi:hypothetical protein